VDSAEVIAGPLYGLPAEHEPLVLRHPAEALPDPAQFLARDRCPLRLGAGIGKVQRLMLTCERNRRLQCRRHRAAPGHRSAPVLNPGEKPLLQGIADVRPACVCASTPSEDHELQSRLPIAVLQILTAQPVAVDSQQQLPLRGRDDRHQLGGIAAPGGARLKRRRQVRRPRWVRKSGRHTCMSSPAPSRPPLYLR
jgi:hypothetical protein